ncbi:MAG: hypothetical protein U0790_04615 [Isosphaeraceae bacterium]
MPRIPQLLSLPRIRKPSSRSAQKARPRLESLEERVVLSEFNFPTPLDTAIPSAPEKKQVLLDKAKGPFTGKNPQLVSQLSYASLNPDTADFRLDAVFPAYFSRPFNDLPINVKASGDLYTYAKADGHPSNRNEYWVDFANARLGGGVFGNGFAQEEVMFLETPELANASAFGVQTRVPNGTQGDVQAPLNGSPQPYIFFDVHKTMTIDLLDPRLTDKSPGDLYSKVTKSDLDQLSRLDATPYKFHVLAMATPDLSHTSFSPTDPRVLQDAFNTFVAGFTLAKGESQKHGFSTPLIDTGKIGAGAFKNDVVAMFVMQELAARQVGVDLKFWYFDKDKPTENIDTLDAHYVQPILHTYRSLPKADQDVTRLLEIATDYLSGAPRITGASVVTVRVQQGRQMRPMLGFAFQFNKPMNTASLANSAIYQVSYASQRRVGRQLVTRYIPVRVLKVNPADSSVVVATRSQASNYPQGGRVIVGVSGLSSKYGIGGGQDVTFQVSPGRGASASNRLAWTIAFPGVLSLISGFILKAADRNAVIQSSCVHLDSRDMSHVVPPGHVKFCFM